MSHAARVVLCVIFTLVLDQSLFGQTKPTETIQPGDLLLVQLHNFGPSKGGDNLEVRVDDESQISLPLVRRVMLRDVSLVDASHIIAKAYADGKFARDPKVEVSLTSESPETKIKPAPISAGEKVLVRVWDLAALGVSSDLDAKVDADGCVKLPHIGNIKVAGLKEYDAEEAISKEYFNKGFLKHAVVMVQRTALADGK